MDFVYVYSGMHCVASRHQEVIMLHQVTIVYLLTDVSWDGGWAPTIVSALCSW